MIETNFALVCRLRPAFGNVSVSCFVRQRSWIKNQSKSLADKSGRKMPAKTGGTRGGEILQNDD
ncbi:MAG: hypothetical protein IPN69_02040 [Acidobacteria bacterium]|nr:hypothetical protein [Acidobacteriota bacterium]